MDARYNFIRMPAHPRADYNGYVREHILIAEAVLGKLLPDDVVVHHHNKNGHDNANNNLVICPNHAYHMLLHQRMRALDACGNASWVPCMVCKKYDSPTSMKKRRRGNYYHVACYNDYAKKYYANQKNNVTASLSLKSTNRKENKVKIIGKTDTGFIVTANEHELAHICGFGYPSELKGSMSLAVGREIQVSKLYQALEVSRARRDDIATLADKLRQIAGRVDTINQALAAPIVEVEIKT